MNYLSVLIFNNITIRSIDSYLLIKKMNAELFKIDSGIGVD